MSKKTIEITNNGLRITGSWNRICGFSRELEDLMKGSEGDEESIRDFNGWRPRENERRKDLKKRTAEKASMKKKKVEKDFKGVKKEISRASKKLKRSVKEIVNEENPVDELKDASKSIGKTIAAESFESVRKMEKFIYEKIMLKFTPYYFDTEDLSINLEKKGKDRYILNVNIMDEKIRNKIKEKIGNNKEDII